MAEYQQRRPDAWASELMGSEPTGSEMGPAGPEPALDRFGGSLAARREALFGLDPALIEEMRVRRACGEAFREGAPPEASEGQDVRDQPPERQSAGLSAREVAAIAGDVAVSLPVDAWYGLGHLADYANPFDEETAADLFAEDRRVAELLWSLLKRAPGLFDEMMRAIAEVYFAERLPEDLRLAIRAQVADATEHGAIRYFLRDRAVTLISRLTTRALSGPVAGRILARIGVSAAGVGSGVGTGISVLTSAGYVERAQRGSDALAASIPALHQALQTQNLDLLWFLVADSIDELEREFRAGLQELGLGAGAGGIEDGAAPEHSQDG
jgi:hypothetical protein